MTAPGGGGGQNINLAALWIPVLPDTSHMGEEMKKAGSEAKSKWEEGFNTGKGPEELAESYTGRFRTSMTKGLNELEIPFGVSKLSEWLEQFSGDVDKKLVAKLEGQATQALRTYSTEQQNLAAAQDRVTESENRLNQARDNGFTKASIMMPLLQEQTAAHANLKEATERTATAHDQLASVTGKLHEEQGKAATSGQVLAGAMGGLVVVGAGLALKAVEAFADMLKEGVEEGIDLTKELAEQTIELGEKYEEIGLGVREYSNATGEAFEDMEARAQKVFGTLDVAGEKTGQTMAQLGSILNAEPGAALDTLTKHVEELQGRFSSLRTQNLGAVFLDFNTPLEDADKSLASLLQSARGSGGDIGQLTQALSGMQGQTLKEAGLNLEQAGAFTAQLMKMGDPGRQAMTGMASAMKEFTAEGYSFADGMKIAGQKLNELGDTAEGQGLAEKLFGTRNWVVAKQAVIDYLDVVKQGPDAFNANSDSLDQFLQQTETLENQWEKVKHGAEDAFKPVAQTALSMVSKALDTLGGYVQSHHDQIVERVVDIGHSFINMLPDIQQFAAGALQFLGTVIDPLKDMAIMVGSTATSFAASYALVTGDTKGYGELNDMTNKLNGLMDKDFGKQFDVAAEAVRGFKLDTGELNDELDKLSGRAPIDPFSEVGGLGEGPRGGSGVPVGGWWTGAGSPTPGGSGAVPEGFTGTPVAPAGGAGGNPLGAFAPTGGQAGIYQDAQGNWHAHDPWWEGVMQAESGGNIAPPGNPTHFGLFQFAQSTWDGIARQLDPSWVGKNPGTAPADVQARFAQQNYDQNKGNLYGQWANGYVKDHPGGTSGSVYLPATGNGNGDGDWNGSGPGDSPYLDPTQAVNAAGGINLQTVAVAAQKFSNDCIDASARIILSHSGVNMSEEALKGVITPGTNINNLAAGLNQLDPQGNFKALAGSGGSPQAMFAAIKASIDSGTGSILNVAPGSSLAGHTFAPGHFIAATGYNGDGTINLSDTAHGTKYSVSEADAYQATMGRGIVAGTGVGPAAVRGAASPLAWNGSGDGSMPMTGTGMPGLPGQYGGYGAYNAETYDQQRAAAKAVQEAQDRAADLDADIAKQQRNIADLQDELAKGTPEKVGPLGGVIAQTPQEAAAAADKHKRLQEQLDDATTALAKTQRERSEQDANISDAQRKQQESAMKSPKSGQSAEGKLGQTLGSGLLAGLGEELGLGDVLGKSPLDWGIVKLAAGLFGYGNNLGDSIFGKSSSAGLGGPGGAGGLSEGIGTGLLGSLGIKAPSIASALNVVPSTVLPGTPASGMGSGPAPGPAIVNNDNSIHVSSDVSDRAVMAPVQAQQNSSNSAANTYTGGFPTP